jgi:NADH-quinone oxidoreductase subunit M
MPQYENSFWLLVLLAVPAVGALVATALPVRVVRGWALGVSLVTLLVSIILGSEMMAADHHALGWMGTQIGAVNASFSLFVDPISIWLVLLTTFLMPLVLGFSIGSIHERQREYYAWMLALLVILLGVFIARDLLLFYIFFELTIVPMFFIIGIWGGPDRRYAASRYFLFTFGGGVFTLASVIYLGTTAHSFDIPTVIHFAQNEMGATARWWVLLGLLAAFAVKTPLFPLHTLPPLAYTEAPAGGAALLAGVVLKSGTYGIFRLALPIGLIATGGPAFPALIKVIGIICVIGVIYAALVAWVQRDIKKLVVYSSISHIGFCVLGLFALNVIGIQGGILYMINHGLSIAALFLIVGMIVDRYGTRDINQLSGLGGTMPILSFFFIFFTLSSIGLPGLNGFVSEFLSILGAFTSDYLGIIFGVLAALGIVLGALYMLHMAAKIIFGPLSAGAEKNDIGLREIAILTPIAAACLILGVKPGLIIDPMLAPVREMRQPLEEQIVVAQPARKTTDAEIQKSLRQRLARMRLDPLPNPPPEYQGREKVAGLTGN